MSIFRAAAALLVLASPGVGLARSADTASNDGQALIAEFGLRESPEAVARRASWRSPRRIVVDAGVPGLADALRAVAPQIEIVPAESPVEMAAAAAVVRTDAAIGRAPLICHPSVLAAGLDLRWLQTVSSGVESCIGTQGEIARTLSGRQILLTNMRAIAGPVIAEHAIAMLLALSRGLHIMIPRQLTGEWSDAFPAGSQPVMLRGKTMLVVGLGGIGAEVAQRANALGMGVIATRASSAAAPAYVRYVGKPEELATLIKDADVVVSAAPLTAATRGLFDAAMFARMKPTAYFINVGRGQSVVTMDLVAALTSGRLAGAGLDVVDPEPLPKDHPLWRAPNLVLTPHVSGQSELTTEAQWRVLRENLRRYAAGERMLSVVDPSRAY